MRNGTDDHMALPNNRADSIFTIANAQLFRAPAVPHATEVDLIRILWGNLIEFHAMEGSPMNAIDTVFKGQAATSGR